MKSANKLKLWLALLLCVLMTAGALSQTASAAEATGKCTNLVNEGIEYYSQVTVMGSDVNKWRQNLKVKALLASDLVTPAGVILGMDIEVTNDTTRYTCTLINPGSGDSMAAEFSCNSVPVNAIINGVYFFYKPNLVAPEDTQIIFRVEEVYGAAVFGTEPVLLHQTYASVKYPPYPCARNLVPRDFSTDSDKGLVLYTETDCDGNTLPNQTLNFFEKYPYKEKYAIVNIMHGDTLQHERMKLSVSPKQAFSYDLTLRFGYQYDAPTDTYGGTVNVRYHVAAETPNNSILSPVDYDPVIDTLTNNELPLVLLGGSLSNVEPVSPNWGTGTAEGITPGAKFEIKFWYENTTGTLGYENSVFHFVRNLNVKFGHSCSDTATTNGLYDPCQSTNQPFASMLDTPIVIPPHTGLWTVIKNGDEKVPVTESDSDWVPQTTQTPTVLAAVPGYQPVGIHNFFFITRKCVNATCDWVTTTNAYPYSIVMSDGGGVLRHYGVSLLDAGTTAVFQMKPYGTKDKPFAIRGVYLVADEPGTYVIYAFSKYSQRYVTTPADDTYYTKIYVTINETNEILTCSTLANNGYFKAWWNDCLSPSETQLLTFEQIPGKEEAWIKNRSSQPIDFPYNPEYSYLPQKMEVASLNCKFEALEAGGRPAEGSCFSDVIHVPPYTMVTITGGTLYLEGYPQYDDYRVAYMRNDTLNISHLFFSVGVKQCENKKIPDTGISLRSPMSPLKVNESIDAATSFVFTGNALRIPAIGLGMETPIPIVHVYYEKGSNNMVWDLSTLGNYVGELEGGSYIPYAGNSVLTGHYWSGGVFKNLEHLNYEDEIIIYGNDGIKYTYKVVEKFIAQPDDVYEMFQQIGDRSLTLVTCENYNLVTDEYERRYIVRASIVSEEPYYETW